MVNRIIEHARELIFLSAFLVLIGTLWTVAWSRSVESELDRGWMPALKLPEGEIQTPADLTPPIRQNAGLPSPWDEESQEPATRPVEEEPGPDDVPPSVTDLH